MAAVVEGGAGAADVEVATVDGVEEAGRLGAEVDAEGEAGGADAVEWQAAVATSNMSPIAGLHRRTLVTPKGLNGATASTLRRCGPNPVPRARRGRSHTLRTKVTSLKCCCTPDAATLASSSVSGVLAHTAVTVRYRTMRRDQLRTTLAPFSASAPYAHRLTMVKATSGRPPPGQLSRWRPRSPGWNQRRICPTDASSGRRFVLPAQLASVASHNRDMDSGRDRHGWRTVGRQWQRIHTVGHGSISVAPAALIHSPDGESRAAA